MQSSQPNTKLYNIEYAWIHINAYVYTPYTCLDQYSYIHKWEQHAKPSTLYVKTRNLESIATPQTALHTAAVPFSSPPPHPPHNYQPANSQRQFSFRLPRYRQIEHSLTTSPSTTYTDDVYDIDRQPTLHICLEYSVEGVLNVYSYHYSYTQ